jgi:hypothetical protein
MRPNPLMAIFVDMTWLLGLSLPGGTHRDAAPFLASGRPVSKGGAAAGSRRI